LFDVPFFFGLVFLGDPAVARGQVQIAFGDDACLQLPSTLEFGVQFATEKQARPPSVARSRSSPDRRAAELSPCLGTVGAVRSRWCWLTGAGATPRR
jgi:hypothetical protein